MAAGAAILIGDMHIINRIAAIIIREYADLINKYMSE
jgi:hypothetical protein